LNQTTECMNILDLAEIIRRKTGAEIRFYKNPRNEDDYNDLKFINDGLLNLGLHPITLEENLVDDIIDIANKYNHRADLSKVICTSLWNECREVDLDGSKIPIKS